MLRMNYMHMQMESMIGWTLMSCKTTTRQWSWTSHIFDLHWHGWVSKMQGHSLYRNENIRTISPRQRKDDIAIQSKSLLQSIETLANEQVKYNPESPAGLWNLGFVALQVKHNGKHPWKSTNDFYNILADCCLLADKVDDDFYRAEAGIEVAMCLVLGGKPIQRVSQVEQRFRLYAI